MALVHEVIVLLENICQSYMNVWLKVEGVGLVIQMQIHCFESRILFKSIAIC